MTEPTVLPEQAPRLAVATEARFTERFALRYRDRLRYNHRRRLWLIYAPPLWWPDSDGEVYRLALEHVRQEQVAALQIDDPDLKKKHMAFALRADSKSGLDRLVGLARNLKPLADAGEGWDADPWLIGTPNGILDLRSSRLEAGNPGLLVTMSTSVPFVRDAQAPRWERFLDDIFSSDHELIAFVQRFIGYCLTGMTTEQALALFYGRGANGKTTFINVISRVLGDYAHNLPFSTIELRQRASIPNDLAALDGRRFVTASETNDGVRLNEARIKALTGCDRLSARFLHGEWFSFQPVAKFVLAVNHKPVVRDDSTGFWRRIRLVPFTQCFEGRRRDDQLEQRLLEEAEGILCWAVEGCFDWQEEGLGDAGAIRAATDEYQDESDPLADFLSTCVEQDPNGHARARELYDVYVQCAEGQGLPRQERLSGKAFGQRMGERFHKERAKSGFVYRGLHLRADGVG